MLGVVKRRVVACALAFIVCAGAPVLQADEAGDFAAAVVPATNRTANNSGQVRDASLASALAEIHGLSEKSKPSAPAAPQTRRTTWSTPAQFFTISQVIARRENRPSPLELASIGRADTPTDDLSQHIALTQGEEPFGLFTFKAPDGLVSAKWRKLEADIDAEAPALERCRAEAATCTSGAARFVAITKDAAELPLRAKLKLVNERINAEIRYTEDWAQWHQADVWSAPLDLSRKGSFDTGLGDCEDYAIAKYVALRQAGVSERDLRVLLVKDQSVHLDHAVLAARDAGHWVILDNRWSRLVDDTDLRQFVPLFALNGDGAKLFAAPYAEGSMASVKEPRRLGAQPYLDAGLSYSARSSFATLAALPLLM